MTDNETPRDKAIESWMRHWEKMRDDLAAVTCPYLPGDYDQNAMTIRVLSNYHKSRRLWKISLWPHAVDERVEILGQIFAVFYAHAFSGTGEGWQRDGCEICRFVDGGYREFFDWHTHAGTRAPDAPLPDGQLPDLPEEFIERLNAPLSVLRRLQRVMQRLIDKRLRSMSPEELAELTDRFKESERLESMSDEEIEEYATSLPDDGYVLVYPHPSNPDWR